MGRHPRTAESETGPPIHRGDSEGSTSRGAPTRPYPAFLNLAGERCLVVGGGPVAHRKALALLGAGARVRVVAPSPARPLVLLRRAGRLTVARRRFRPSDVTGCRIVIAASDDPLVNAAVARACAIRGTLVNVVDTPALCGFIVPAVVRRGPLTIAISTGGRSPLGARIVRRIIARAVGREHARFVALMGRIRQEAKRAHATPAMRKAALTRCATAEIFDLLRRGKMADALELARERAGLPSGSRGRARGTRGRRTQRVRG